ncbi:MAG: DNA polymerase III subunit beta [Planctomycetota bacterium]|jgi:DNA polymerase-3 subunit beta
MKVICDRGALVDAVNLVGSVVVSRTPTPVLTCAKLTAADGRLTLAATDLEVGLRLTVDQVEIESDGEALVPADKLTQIVRACDDPTLTIETDGSTTIIRGADSYFKVFGYDPAEAPEVVEIEDPSIDCEIDGPELQSLVSRTLFAAAAEHSRYAINGVLFERTGRKLRLVATDGRRLAVARGDCRTGEGDSSVILPTKALQLVNKLIAGADGTVRIATRENQAVFFVGEGEEGAILSTKLVEGAFPPFEDVIPKDQDKRVTFDAAALSRAVRRAALLTNEESKGVRMKFDDKILTLHSRAPEMGEAEIQLDMESYEGEPLEIGFNPGYITEALKVMDETQVIVELKAPNKPGVFRAGQDFTYVIMPVNLQ